MKRPRRLRSLSDYELAVQVCAAEDRRLQAVKDLNILAAEYGRRHTPKLLRLVK